MKTGLGTGLVGYDGRGNAVGEQGKGGGTQEFEVGLSTVQPMCCLSQTSLMNEPALPCYS